MTNKNTEQLHSKLFSGNETIVFETLDFIKESGSVLILPSLLDLYATSSNKSIKSAIFELLTDIKNPDFPSAYIALITQEKYSAIYAELLSVCWQSSLSFSNHSDLFIDGIIRGSFGVAFEALTCCDTIAPDLSSEKRANYVSQLKSQLSSISSDKKDLVYDAIRILN